MNGAVGGNLTLMMSQVKRFMAPNENTSHVKKFMAPTANTSPVKKFMAPN